MDWFEMEVDEKRSSKFADRAILGHDDSTDYLGGIIYGGQWGWMTNRYAKDATLVICTLSEGNCIMRHVFWREEVESGGKRCSIRCVEELFPGQSDGMTLLAVCLETWSDKESQPENCDKAQTQIAILSTHYSQVLRYIDLDGLYCSTLTFLDTRIRQRTRLQNFDGCLAVGTDSGAVLLCDIKRSALITGRSQNIRLPRSEIDCGQVIRRHSSECSMDQIITWLQECPNDGHLAVELDVAKGEVRCLICVNSITGIAVGLKDGRIVMYDLESFHITTVIRPPGDLACSVERLCDVVPPDDPKPCLFIFGIYSGASHTTALLHCIHYRHSYADAQSNELYFKNFKNTETCARLMLDDGHISVLGCTTASTFSFSGDNGTLLVIIGWYSHQQKTNKLVLFDMNQWYKDEMPNCLHLLDEKPYFVVGYTLTGKAPGLGFHLSARSIKHFISLQRYDEHFYPNSLTFDLCLLTARGGQYHVHVGSQHSFLRKLQGQNATIFLYADDTHADIVRLRLMPQFGELNPDATFSKRAIYEEILSVALEHGCMGLLKNCAKGWIDGSYMFNLCIPTELTLLTFTAWIVKRAAQTKTRCSELCESIFDYGGYPLDERERKELKVLNGQLGNLDNLQAFIVNLGRRSLAPAIIREIEDNAQRIRTFYTYQRVLLFFIEWGLVPEGQQEQDQHQPSALAQLQSIYANRHTSVGDNRYINGLLRRIGQETSSGAAVALVYPPRTLHFLLHLMLAFNTDLENKHEVILYLLYDLDVVQPAGVKLSDRFEASFGLTTQLVTRVKSLWHLEHDNHAECMKVLSSSLCPDSPYQSWHVELLVEALLAKGAISDAMSVVYRPPGPLASLTRLKVLMASKNIPEAFEYARRNDDEETGRPLLEYFFRQSIEMRQFKALAQLCLRDTEEELALRLLRECRTPLTDSVQLILLLQKCKYIEAVSFMDEVAAEREIADESSRAIIYAYRSTMNPVSQTLAGDYFRIRENLDVAPAENVHPVPFSCQLARDYASGLRGGVFQSSALGARWATVYSTDSAPKEKGPMPCHQVPFLRSSLYGLSQLPHRRRTVRPVPHQAVEKRVREQEESELTVGTATQSTLLQPSKRRRLLNEQLVKGVCDFVGDKLNPKTDQGRNDAEQQQQQQQANDLLQLPSYLRLKRTPQPQKTPPVTILKRRTALEAVEGTPPMATSTSMGEAKRLRFMPPKPLPGHGPNEAIEVDSLLNRQQADEVALDEDEEETDEIIVEIESASDFQRPNSNSNHSSEEEEEEDEFVSPLTSPHVSLVSPRLKVAPEATHETIVRPMAPPAGPQPRSSLIQAGRSESSSGFGSFASILTAETASHEFVPTVCSSKMGAQSTFSIGAATASATATASTSVKISERTTICGEMDETEPESATTDWYSSPSVRLEEHEPEQEHKELQMLDTTLGMSTYDVTAPEQREEAHLLTKNEDDDHEMQVQVVEVTDGEEEEEIQLEEIDDEDEEQVEQEQELEQEEQEEEEEKDPELMEEYLQETQDDDAQLAARPSSLNRTYMGSSDDPPQERSSSPSLSLSSMSCMSSAHFMPEMMQSGDAMYSIVIESTASVTTSRSVTHTHTPTSFLPSDTNVSQNSSPRATRGTGGDGSPPALYRANSLETVDDLDTTKGSLEEEEEEEEDDCVIALDGTRVGGYVARPTPQSAPSSSAELFAFKDDTQKEHASVDGPSLSVGATATSPSIVILDSSEDEADQEDEIMLEVQAEAKTETETEAVTYLDSDSGPDSVSDTGSGTLLSISPSSTASGSSSTSKSSTIGAAAAAKKLLLAPLPEIAEDMELELEMEVPADHEEESESKAEQKEEQQAEKEPETVAHDEDSKQSLTLAFSDDEEERAPTGATAAAAAAAAPVATRALRPRTKSMNSPVPPTPPKATRRVRLRSDDCPPSGSAGSLDRAVSTPPVSTPKRRHAALRKYSLEVIDEQKSLGSGGPTSVRTRARTQLSMEREPEPEPETDTQAKSTRSKRAHSTAPQSTTTTKTERRQSRGASEPPVKSTSKKQTRKRSTAEEKLPEAAELASVPPVRRTSRRLSSGLSDHQPSPSTTPVPETSGRELRPRRLRTDSDSVSSPATRTATPTPKQVNSEANVPLKKRARPKIMDDGDGSSKK
ncbi:protein ELYS homolog [Drosophila madeirensis]|uniref:Protein ELYS homolog n=1 Tax=Drosophila madeirensis TaxID=30013 RepID=A0AAU9G453_DROMD